MTLVDLEAKEELLKREFPHRVMGASVSDSGEIVVVTKWEEVLLYYDTGRPRKVRSYGKIYYLNRVGKTIYESEVLEDIGRDPRAKVVLRVLGWEGSTAICGRVERKNKRVQIFTLGAAR